MAESEEHKFIKTCITDTLKKFSNSKLYGYSEADRRKFDLACMLERDWSRPLVGQVLWRNTGGIDKDIRTLINDTDSEIKIYAISLSSAHRSTFFEVMNDYKRSGNYPDLFKVKPIIISSKVDVDKESDRQKVSSLIQSQIVDDILFNVIFGNLNKNDLKLLFDVGGIGGLHITVLYKIATQRFNSLSAFCKSMDISAGPVRETLPLLHALRLIESKESYVVSQKGRVLLDIIGQIYLSYQSGIYSDELLYILEKLDCIPQKNTNSLTVSLDDDPRGIIFPGIIICVDQSIKRWEYDFTNSEYNGSLKVQLAPY